VKNETEAARYFKLAADQNDASSQNRYAICLATGQGVVKDEAEAAQYYKLATDQNDALVQFNYGVCVAKGRDVPKNEAEATWSGANLRNRCRLFERQTIPIAWPTGVGLRTTTPRLTRFREMQRVSGVDGERDGCSHRRTE
jgi:hypothetical protein